jgi:hypothetical protein
VRRSALVTAGVEMVVLAPFAVCSPIASSCTGTCWDAKSGKPKPGAPTDRIVPLQARMVGETFIPLKSGRAARQTSNNAESRLVRFWRI